MPPQIRTAAEHATPFAAALASLSLENVNTAAGIFVALVGAGFTLHRWLDYSQQTKAERRRRSQE